MKVFWRFCADGLMGTSLIKGLVSWKHTWSQVTISPRHLLYLPSLRHATVHSAASSSRVTPGSLPPRWQKRLFDGASTQKKKPNGGELFFFFLARPFQSGLLIRLQCLLDGAVRRPSTGADAHLSSHVALSRLRPVWRRACALIYSIFGPLPPPVTPLPWLTLRKRKKKISWCQLTSPRSFSRTWTKDVAALLVGFNQWCSLVYSSVLWIPQNPPGRHKTRTTILSNALSMHPHISEITKDWLCSACQMFKWESQHCVKKRDW